MQGKVWSMLLCGCISQHNIIHVFIDLNNITDTNVFKRVLYQKAWKYQRTLIDIKYGVQCL